MNLNPNNNNTCEASKFCKQRYKGIENFLRRVAFNLGNSPSQTEVKIISCIPIDVTDLQNKIVSLERQLHEAKNPKGSCKNIPVHTTLTNDNTVITCKCSDEEPLVLKNSSRMASQYGDGSSKARKSTVSFLFPSWSATGLSENRQSVATENEAAKESPETSNGGHRKNFFRRGKKKKAGMKKMHPNPMVYYAHTENSPFNNFGGISTKNLCKNNSKVKVENILSKTCLANIIQRHFDQERAVEEFSDTSQFTSPVCRDFPSGHCLYESDVCSCCHEQFQNVDKYMSKNQNFIIEPITTHRLNKNIYYDSNHYDIIPVKEKAIKVIKEEKLSKKERPVHTQYWPEDTRSKPRYQLTVHNQTKVPTKLKNHKKPMTRPQEYETYKRKKSPERVKNDVVNQTIGPSDTSKSCCVDCSEVYTKPILPKHINRKVESTQPKRRQNSKCLTIDVATNKLAITRSIQIDINSVENKTEKTLNQIKSILQSVLAEVKTNPQINNIHDEKPKKDNVIQNAPSQSNIQTCSSLLHSFTYNNSFDTKPYMPSFSRQIPSNFCCTNVPCQRRYTQNFPLLIHPPRHRTCECFDKSTGHTSKPIQRQAATTATNTEFGDEENSTKETDKLIKEIYKSIALTMDITKKTSNSECDELKFTSMDSEHENDPKRIRNTIVAMSTVQKRDKQTEASIMTTVQSYNNSSRGTISQTKETEVDYNRLYESQATETDVIPKEELLNRPKAIVASTISENDSEELSSNDDGDEIVEESEDIKVKTERNGLLRRMLKSVKLFNKRDQNKFKIKQNIKLVTEDEQTESDSDDYQTIYSEKSKNKSQPFNRQYNKPRAYQTYRPSQQRVRTNRRSPYMEQEYRRQWEENLIFQENRGRRYSSERPFSVQKTPSQLSPFWQNYEARSVIVNTPYSRKTYSPVRNFGHKVEKRTSTINFIDKTDVPKSKISWLKKHKLGVHCVKQWKKCILEN